MPEYCSYFTGGGILMPPSSYDKTCQLIIDFLTQYLKIPLEDLKVDIAEQDEDLIKFWKEKVLTGLQHQIHNYPSDDFRWKFGEKGLTGRGLILSIKDVYSNRFGEFSTLEAIEKDNNKIAIEWGFGLETFVCRRLGLRHPIEASNISEIFPNASFDNNIKLFDSINTAAAILNEGVQVSTNNSSKASTILRRFLNAIVYYSRENNFSVDDIRTWINYLCANDFFETPTIESSVSSFVQRARGKEIQFMEAIRNAINGKC